MARLDPKDWIDAQNAAGDKRGNIFTDILEECARRRAERRGPLDQYTERRTLRVDALRTETKAVDPKERASPTKPVPPSFDDLVKSWETGA